MSDELVPIDDGPKLLPAPLGPVGSAMVQTRTSYCTAVAVQKPRSLKEVERRLLEEATLAGEDFFYGWGAGKDKVEGPSIKLANAAARCWGNCAVELGPVQETADAWIFTAFFVDLETGFTLPRQFRQSKLWTVHGKMDVMRKDDVRFQIGQSKAIRNVILNALPQSIVDRAMSKAKEGVRAELERLCKANSFATVADRLVAALAKEGVREEAVLAKCQVAERKGLSIDDMVILRGDLAAIQSGQERAADLFPAAPAPNRTEQLAEDLGRKPEPVGQSPPAPPPPPAEAPKGDAYEPPAEAEGDAPLGGRANKKR